MDDDNKIPIELEKKSDNVSKIIVDNIELDQILNKKTKVGIGTVFQLLIQSQRLNMEYHKLAINEMLTYPCNFKIAPQMKQNLIASDLILQNLMKIEKIVNELMY